MTDERKDLPPVTAPNFLQRVRETLQTYLGSQGNALDRGITVRDLAEANLISVSDSFLKGSNVNPIAGSGSGSSGGSSGSGGSYEVDLTKPPTPTGFTATAGLSYIYFQTATPSFTAGHGFDHLRIYGAKYTTGPLPTFSSAVELCREIAPLGSYPSATGTTWRLWVTWVSKDGVESDPAGGTNGLSVTTGKIGNSDLNSAIIEAANLASGAITVAGFASTIEPVSLVSSVPGSKSTNTVFNTADGKLYRWNGSAYIATVPAADLSGTVTNAQIAGLAASKITGALTDSQLADISAAKITGQIVGTQITDGAVTTAKLFAGSVTTAKIAADAITANEIAAGAVTATELASGSVTTAKLTAGAVTANEIASGAVTAGKIAANAVTATELAADSVTAGKIASGAISTSKLLVTGLGASLWLDPNVQDTSAWRVSAWGSIPTQTTVSDGKTGNKTWRAGANTYSVEGARRVPITEGKRYRISSFVRRSSDANGVLYLRVSWGVDESTGFNQLYPGGPDLATYSGGVEGLTVGTSWARYSWEFVAGSSPKFMAPLLILNYGGSAGWMEAQDIRIEEMVGADLIVDGSIAASKIAANAIAVGTAAIQNGAIVNAMLGDATIDSAKIANAAITTAKIADGQITSAKITDATITTAKIADGQITSAKITDGTITTAKIADGQITSAKIADASITAAKIVDATITTAKIADGQITNAKITDATVTSAKIADLAVTGAKIANAAIVTANIQDGAITSAKIGDAQVSTLKIGANAVTVPVSAQGGGSAATPYADFAGQPVVVVASCSAVVEVGYLGRMYLYRDGTLLTSRYTSVGGPYNPYLNYNYGEVVYQDYPGSGSHNYTVVFNTDSGFALGTTVVALGVKR